MAGLMVCVASACAEGTGIIGDAPDAADDGGGMHTPPPTVDMGPVAPPPTIDQGPRCPAACCPGALGCVDTETVGVCLEDGSGWSPMENCSESGKRCVDGACRDDGSGVCTPGQPGGCHDGDTRLICRGNGEGYRIEDCPAGQACQGGMCVSGAPTGSVCQVHDDCAGGRCHCGDGTEEECLVEHTPAYCTRPCPEGGCGDGEWCFATSVYAWNNVAVTYDHCVPACEATCGAQGMACRQVPVQDGGELRWEKGCFYEGLSNAGDACSRDTECITGTCLSDYIRGGFCSMRCEQAACPQDTACVQIRSGEWWCSPECRTIEGAERCPLDEPDERFDVTCKTMITRDGKATRVCAKT